MRHPQRPALWLALATCSLVWAAVVWSQDPLPVSDLKALIQHDAELVNKALVKLTKNNDKRAKAGALLIAAYAQENLKGKDGHQMATIRDRALAVLKALEKGDADQAKKLAADLGPGLAADKNAKAEGTDLVKLMPLDTLMKVYASERFGGFNLEKSLEELADLKGDLSAAEAAKAALLGHKNAAIALLTAHHAPEKDDGAKTKASWVDFSKDTRGAALALAAAAKSKSGDAIAKAAQKLSAACTKCHDVFRK
jgi:hypothetical protein